MTRAPRPSLGLLLCLGAIVAAGVAAVESSTTPYVIRSTASGPVGGLRHQSVLGREVDVFLGIPFALPPVGSRRFRRPEPHPKWEQVKNATELPPSCHQSIDTSFDRFQGVDMWNPNTKVSDDCLYLNVWQPVAASGSTKKKAVLVWIYGGGFVSGTSTLELYDARILAAAGDVVVVSMQYRLGILGFLYLGIPDAPGNQGLLDQRLALLWVQQNIEFFDGDPKRVTVFGESAGACSASLHLLSPISKHLIKSAIMQSASPIAPWGVITPTSAKSRALNLAKSVGCQTKDEDNNDVEVLECLKQTDLGELTNATLKQESTGMSVFAPFPPTVDDYFLRDMPSETLKQGLFHHESILLGVNRDEGFYFLAYMHDQHFRITENDDISEDEFRAIIPSLVGTVDVVDLATTRVIAYEYGAPFYSKNSSMYRKALDDILGDIAFKCPVVNFALSYAQRNRRVYLYDFNHRTSANPWPSWMGVMHGYEIDHVFGMPLNGSFNYTEDEKLLSEKMIRYWTNFAKTGNPNQNEDGKSVDGEPEWPIYRPNDRQVLLLQSNLTIALKGIRDRECYFWRSVVPKLQAAVANTCSGGVVLVSDPANVVLILLLYYSISQLLSQSG